MSERMIDVVAKQIVAGELLAIRNAWQKAAEKQRDAGLEAAAELSTATAGILSDFFRTLTGRHPGEVGS